MTGRQTPHREALSSLSGPGGGVRRPDPSDGLDKWTCADVGCFDDDRATGADAARWSCFSPAALTRLISASAAAAAASGGAVRWVITDGRADGRGCPDRNKAFINNHYSSSYVLLLSHLHAFYFYRLQRRKLRRLTGTASSDTAGNAPKPETQGGSLIGRGAIQFPHDMHDVY